MPHPFKVTVNFVREYSATITVDARDQEEADEKALEAFNNDRCADYGLGLPEPWYEHESYDYDPYIDRRFRCVDCDKSRHGEYYMVSDEAVGRRRHGASRRHAVPAMPRMPHRPRAGP